MADDLTGEEIVMLIEALDAMLGPEDAGLPGRAQELPVDLQPFWGLRRRLKEAVRVSFYDTGRGWLAAELSREREATGEKLLNKLYELLADPKATRKSIKLDFGRYSREMRDGDRLS